MRRRSPIVFVGVVVVFAAGGVAGQGKIEWDNGGAYAGVGSGVLGDVQPIHGEVGQSAQGGSASLTASQSYNQHGFTSNAGTNWAFQYDTGNPLGQDLFGAIAFQGEAWQSGANTNPAYDPRGEARGFTHLSFYLAEETTWAWDAHVAGTASDKGSAAYHFRIWQGSEELVWDRREGTFDEQISLGGTLSPGSYTVAVDLQAGSGFTDFGAYIFRDGEAPPTSLGVGEAHAYLTDGVFSLIGPVPTPGAGAVLGLAAIFAAQRRRG